MAVRRRRNLKQRKHRKVRKHARRGKRSGIPRGMPDAGQMARIKETVSFTDLNPNLSYGFVFNLSQFRRASALAPNFKFYKATMVEWTIEPLYNTFQDGTSGSEITIPYLFMTMNRTQDKVGLYFADYQAMGCKPQKLNSTKTIKYRPNWCSPGLQQMAYVADDASGNPTGRKLVEIDSAGLRTNYEWLECPNYDPEINNNPTFNIPLIAPSTDYPPGISVIPSANISNQVVYNGHNLWVDQLVTTGVLQAVARVTCTVHWSFKGPHRAYETYQAPTNILPKTA